VNFEIQLKNKMNINKIAVQRWGLLSCLTHLHVINVKKT